jgi:arylsulfatase A-like enzyme
MDKNKNILFICVDDLRPELGCYGSDHVLSPNIDSIASDAAVFERNYCQVAVCNPSRSSMLTGRRPDDLAVWGLYEHFRELNKTATTMPQYFKENGFHSCAIGKIFHNDRQDPVSWSEPKLHIKGYPYDPDAVYRDEDNREYLEFRKKEITNQGDSERYIDEYGEWYLKASATECIDAPDDIYYDGAQTDVAVEKLKQLATSDKPFFFGVGYYRPHLPFNVPKKYWDMYERENIDLAEFDTPPEGAPDMALNNMRELRGYTDFTHVKHPKDAALNEDEARLLRHGYFASVTYVDTQIGKLTACLKELGLYDDTIIVLWGDNGWKLGDYGSWGKMTNYEQDTRVPLIIKPAGKNVDGEPLRKQIVESVDIFPTLCELAGIESPPNQAGTSLVPLILSSDREWPNIAYSQIFRYGIWHAPDGREKMGYTIRTDKWRYVLWFDKESRTPEAKELYDIQTQRLERVNLSGSPEFNEIENKLSKKLLKYIDYKWCDAAS